MGVLQQRRVVSPSVVAAELDDEGVLLNVETGIYFGLDGVGNHIWKLLARGATDDEIVQDLLTIYDAEPWQVQRDVREFVGLLEARGLIQSARS